MTSYRPLVVALAAALCGLALVNWRLATTPVDVTITEPDDAAVATNETSAPKPEAENLAPRRLALGELTETLERPLFSPDRRPPPPVAEKGPEPAAAVTTEPDPSPAGLRLVGMMRRGSADQRALIRVPGKNHASWVTVGTEIGGWTVRAIEKDKVVVESRSRRAELVLRAPPTPPGDGNSSTPAGTVAD